MATPELIASWGRTEEFLLQARAALSPGVTTRFATQIEIFIEFISHNELGLAFDVLLDLVDESECATVEVLQPLLMAAENMNLTDTRDALAMQLATLAD